VRFSRLDIPAFGPFTDFTYQFNDSASGDFHIFHGNNESGKSSLLRAISNLLFGIDPKTRENFIHDYGDLELCAELERHSGDRLQIRRRKGTGEKKLTDFSGNPLRQDQLNAFMGNLTREQFQALFGLGAEELQLGNDLLLDTNGALAETIAAASSGSTELSDAVKSLHAKSTELYRQRGSSVLSTLKKRVTEAESELREATTKPGNWQELNDQISTLADERALLRKQLSGVAESLSFNKRMEDGIKLVGQLKQARSAWSALSMPANLPEGVAASLVTELADWQLATTGKVASEEKISGLTNDLEALAVQQEVIDNAASIEKVTANLAVYQNRLTKSEEMSASLGVTKSELEKRVKRHSGAVGLEQIESMRMSREQEMLCTDNFFAYSSASKELGDLDIRISEIQDQLDGLYQSGQSSASAHGGKQGAASAALDSDGDEHLSLQSSPDSAESKLTLELDQAIEQGMRQFEPADSLKSRFHSYESMHSDINLRQKRLGLSLGSAEKTGASHRISDIATLKIPGRASIQEYVEEVSELERLAAATQEQLETQSKSVTRLEVTIDHLAKQRALPSVEMLDEVRAKRDENWRELSRQLKDARVSQNIPQTELALGDDGTGSDSAFHETNTSGLVNHVGKLISQSDELADSLIENAEIVASIAEKQLQLKQAREEHQRLQAKLAECKEKTDQLQLRWLQLWPQDQVSPGNPRAMLEWQEEWLAVCEMTEQSGSLSAALVSDLQAIQQACSRLASIPELVQRSGINLQDVGNESNEVPALETIVAQSSHLKRLVLAAQEYKALLDNTIGANREAAILREKAGHQINKLRAQRSETHALVVSNEQRLVNAFAGIGIAIEPGGSVNAKATNTAQPGLSPEASHTLLLERKSLVESYDEYQQQAQELQQLQDEMNAFSQTVTELASVIGLERSGSIESLSKEMTQLLRHNEAATVSRNNLSEALDEENNKLVKGNQKVELLLQSLNQYAKMFNSDSPDSLLLLKDKLNSAENLRTQMQTLEETIAQIAGTTDINRFTKQVEDQNQDKLSASHEELVSLKAELEQKNEELLRQQTLLEQKRSAIENEFSIAADKRQSLELLYAEQKSAVLEFIRYRLAEDMLHNALEHYRESHQGPLLDEASALFTRLTCGSFDRIVLSYTADEKVFIQGAASDGRKLDVSQMSDGSRDQLYLAMRLAALKLHLQSHEPMPLIVDDLLITFDDGRTEAALEVLAEISRLTQVILFTHHARVLDSSRRLFSKNQVCVTELGQMAG